MEPFNNPSTEKPQRTFLLWFLAICTMINAGMNVFSFSMYAFFPNFIQQSMEVVKNIPAFNNAQYQETLELFLTIPQWKFGLLILAEAAAFATPFTREIVPSTHRYVSSAIPVLLVVTP